MTVATLHGALNDVNLPSNLIPKAEARAELCAVDPLPPNVETVCVFVCLRCVFDVLSDVQNKHRYPLDPT